MAQPTLTESSFRDPSGFLFRDDERLLRQINESYREDYDHLLASGLYAELTGEGMLIKHDELKGHPGHDGHAYRVLQPELVPFISYPYEWSFGMLKDAALLTLSIQKAALQHEMTLKDATAYNIQFHKGKPVFIDTLSFERHDGNSPWQAYRQFCQHFLAPLALMSRTDIRMNQLLKIYIDGIPLDLASQLLPAKTRANVLLLMHIHLHAKSQKKYEKEGTASREVRITRKNLLALVDSLSYLVRNLKVKEQETEWGRYYTFTNYTDHSFTLKKEILQRYLQKISPSTLWDLGANTGEFTRIAMNMGVSCVAFDIDPVAVETNYRITKQEGETKMLPLVMDLTNPSPSIGWNNTERMSMVGRGNPDAAMALALIHHLAISNNLPFSRIASFFAGICRDLLIEFVPKTDSQVKKLLESRKDIFPGYDESNFEQAFSEYFEIVEKTPIEGSERTLYHMKNRKNGLQ